MSRMHGVLLFGLVRAFCLDVGMFGDSSKGIRGVDTFLNIGVRSEGVEYL